MFKLNCLLRANYTLDPADRPAFYFDYSEKRANDCRCGHCQARRILLDLGISQHIRPVLEDYADLLPPQADTPPRQALGTYYLDILLPHYIDQGVFAHRANSILTLRWPIAPRPGEPLTPDSVRKQLCCLLALGGAMERRAGRHGDPDHLSNRLITQAKADAYEPYRADDGRPMMRPAPYALIMRSSRREGVTEHPVTTRKTLPS